MQKFIIPIVIIITLLGLLVKGLWEPHILDVTRTIIGSGKNSIKILLLSDIHARFYFIKNEKIEKLIKTEELDAILFVGDLSSDNKDFEKGIKIITKIKKSAQEYLIPVYAVSGNHDPAELRKRLNEIDIIHLKNECKTITAKDRSKWKIVGLEDLRTGNPSYSEGIKNSSSDDIIPNIVLAHNPDSIFGIIKDLKNTKQQPDVFLLSGHFHGGQIWMPFGIEYLIMRSEKMCKEGYRKGYYERDGIRGYITRGLGCVIVPIRLFSKPEASIIELKHQGFNEHIQEETLCEPPLIHHT